MKHTIYIALAALALAGCSKQYETQIPGGDDLVREVDNPAYGAPVPEGYFVATLSTKSFDPLTRAAISGPDSRIRHLRYLLYNDDSDMFVKERVLLTQATTPASWPLQAVRDTLPKGNYRAVFVGNTDPAQFAYGNPLTTRPVITDYTGAYDDARITLPPTDFTDQSEYYWANVTFSDAHPDTTILLQRILGMENLHRNTVDAQRALDSLVKHIIAGIDFETIIATEVDLALPGGLTAKIQVLSGIVALLNTLGLGSVTNLVGNLVDDLAHPVTLFLYNQLLARLTDDVGNLLTGNTNHTNMIQALGILVNPWSTADAQTAIVTIDAFPRAIDFDLAVRSTYPNGTKFRYDFPAGSPYEQKNVIIRGFSGVYDIRRIDVIKQGLVKGLVIDQIAEGLLLPGFFVDIDDPLTNTVATNIRYRADYSFVDLYLQSYDPVQDNAHKITLIVQLSQIANIDSILANAGVVGILVGGLVTAIKSVSISVPVYLPLLDASNVTLSGSWSDVEDY